MDFGSKESYESRWARIFSIAGKVGHQYHEIGFQIFSAFYFQFRIEKLLST
jgi:hypothetical protein